MFEANRINYTFIDALTNQNIPTEFLNSLNPSGVPHTNSN